ncbi:MAG: hypothetical protein AB1403_20145 [Candidatus Riflebacteria bacterium]
MRKILLILLPLMIAGCSQTADPVSGNAPASLTPVVIPGALTQASTVSVTGPVKPQIALSPLEKAQKEYLAAYDNYVRLLRESGPQTLETLQALADYQKKYQIYQMLVKAEKNP